MELDAAMRVSLVWGEDDALVPPFFAHLLHQLRPRTDLYMIREAEHNPAHDRVDAFAEAVADALAAPPHPFLDTTSGSDESDDAGDAFSGHSSPIAELGDAPTSPAFAARRA
eukprot:CAMPEP_0203820340 /NCGR_PEP_ID=MMETSP0115-20131106/39483_1 /ASSEMBLY_ACC=CAM_ASM_000227 /TAXON_ID=33651 /ORGANISM="Bicosoecid sp, Strain ms1" /LENGTH=111 /DNA_ID=CAMNT_0050729349 /DNA_START=11 /DNA_END=343 /DNA_ORIENTATION=+